MLNFPCLITVSQVVLIYYEKKQTPFVMKVPTDTRKANFTCKLKSKFFTLEKRVAKAATVCVLNRTL